MVKVRHHARSERSDEVTQERSTEAEQDLVMLQRWREGDNRAGDALFKKYYDPMDRFFRGKVRDQERGDLVHNVFLSLMKTADGFRGDCSVRSHIYRIAQRVLIDFYRKKRRNFDPLTHSVVDLAGLAPSRVLSEVNRHRALQRCIEALPLAQQQLIELYYWEGMTSVALAPVFGISQEAVRTRVFVVRKALRVCLAKCSPGGGQLVDEDDLDTNLEELARFFRAEPARPGAPDDDGGR
jgi:RNA polymerase sigma-70 factor (ECF subfamily)